MVTNRFFPALALSVTSALITLDKLNACMAEIVEDANAGRPSDIENLAARYQLETKTLRAMVQDLKSRLGAVKKDFPESS